MVVEILADTTALIISHAVWALIVYRMFIPL